MLPAPNSNFDRTVFLIKTNKNKRLGSQSSTLLLDSPHTSSCLICMRAPHQSPFELHNSFCKNCINKQMCSYCIQQITSLPCPFCHTNNKTWRKAKRDVLFDEIQRKIQDKRRFWIGLRIKEKNVHMQYAIKSGIQEYIHVLDGLVEKLTEDIKYLVKLDFQKEDENEADVLKEIEEINMMEETYDKMMIELKNEFGVELTSD